MGEVVVAAAVVGEAIDVKVDAVGGVEEEEEEEGEGEGGPHHHQQQRQAGPAVTKVINQMGCHSEIIASTLFLPILHSGPSRMLE